MACINLTPAAQTALAETLQAHGSNHPQKFTTAAEAAENLQPNAATLALVDIWNGSSCCLRDIRVLKTNFSRLSIVVFTSRADPSAVLQALAAGADGHIIHPLPSDELRGLLALPQAGHTALCALSVDLLLRTYLEGIRSPSTGTLSIRERQVLAMIAAHRSNKEISGELGVAQGTVHSHITNILGKLKVPSRGDAVRKWFGGV